ncbi:MAG: adenosylcobinamide-phosphate synthase CbiB [Acidiphilium sp.]|nr:adenosylcobinamide-phosphate synthase CbiB [Acidiphilium sp.]MDD4935591.1 adenosylcobinamide-phosphate synthase CbiB [Acidiphilium sp.]
MNFAITLPVAALALTIEAIAGYPTTIFRAIRHPVMWVGALIAGLDTWLNDPALSFGKRQRRGIVAVIAIVLAAGVPAMLAQIALIVLLPRLVALAALAFVASSLLAGRSLAEHVRAVAEGLRAGGVEGGRAAVAHIVGRDPASLDEAGVARAAIESLAENFSDAVVAPALWCALLGLPGIAIYKAMNTADSMVGHRTKRHEAFGWAAARLDDGLNLPASRLAAVWIVIAAVLHPHASGSAALRVLRHDARRHRSPNAGWPEAAIAGALGLRLAGPRVYGAIRVDDAWMGDGRAQADAADIVKALALFRLASLLQIGVVWLFAIFILPG